MAYESLGSPQEDAEQLQDRSLIQGKQAEVKAESQGWVRSGGGGGFFFGGGGCRAGRLRRWTPARLLFQDCAAAGSLSVSFLRTHHALCHRLSLLPLFPLPRRACLLLLLPACCAAALPLFAQQVSPQRASVFCLATLSLLPALLFSRHATQTYAMFDGIPEARLRPMSHHAGLRCSFGRRQSRFSDHHGVSLRLQTAAPASGR